MGQVPYMPVFFVDASNEVVLGPFTVKSNVGTFLDMKEDLAMIDGKRRGKWLGADNLGFGGNRA